MAGSRTERLLNLVIALRATRRGMRREELRRAVPQYAASPNETAFERMFERDKEDLREIGVPIVTVRSDVLSDTDDAYRIDSSAYELPPVTFSSPEVVVLGLAAHVWQQAALAVPAARALTKLKAVGASDDPMQAVVAARDLAGLLDPVVRTVEPAFSPLHDALRLGHVVRFGYRRPDGERAERTVHPWRLVLRAGTWYLVGRDEARAAARVFRLSRIDGPVHVLRARRSDPPPGEAAVQGALRVLGATEARRGGPADDEARRARLRLTPGRGGRLRAMAARAGQDPGAAEILLPLRGGDPDRDDHLAEGLVEAVAATGADVTVLEPPELVAAVGAVWRGVQRRHAAPTGETGQDVPDGSSPAPPAHGPGATERLSRLLALVPFVLRRDGVTLGELAGHFDVTERQVVKDLELLFVCGTPGHLPDDLIEADWEGGVVRIGNAEPISRPLRLTGEEAVVLLLGLRLLAEVPGPHDRAALTAATATLEALTDGQDAHVGLVPDPWGPPVHADTVTRALLARRRLRLLYLSAGRDELTERDVDPRRIVHEDGRHYLEGWCHRAGDVRLFRLDRIVRADVLDETAPPGPPEPGHTSGQVPAAPGDLRVLLRLHRGARWVAEHYPVEQVAASDGVQDVRLRTADPDRVVRLVLGLGGRAEVLAPPWLRARLLDAATTALGRTGEAARV